MMPPHPVSRDVLQPPGLEHWLGTNDIGQDVFIGLIVAAPNTILVALVAGLISLALSVAIAAAAMRGVILSSLVLRIVDILQAMPSIFILLLLAAWVRPNFAGAILLLALTSWHDDVRVLRAIMLREITRENIHYARRMGGSRFYCLAHHVLPAMRPAIMGLYLQNVCSAAMRVAGLGFLGLTDPRLLTWGGMMQDGLAHLYGDAWRWLLLPPACCLSLFLLALLVLGRHLERPAVPASADHP